MGDFGGVAVGPFVFHGHRQAQRLAAVDDVQSPDTALGFEAVKAAHQQHRFRHMHESRLRCLEADAAR